jgi:hypothetical protein
MSVFVSYSTKDNEFVTQLSSELVKRQIPIWLDKWEMQPGDSLINKIQNGLTKSAFLLVVLSKNSIKSEWCKRELNAGLMRELEEKKVIVIPILIDNCKIPLFLKEKLYADFRTDFEQGFKSLLRPLSKLSSEHMGRTKKKGVTIDYCRNWGIEDNFYYLNIDFVIWHIKENKSILFQIHITGCENATKRFFSWAEMGQASIMNESVIEMMYQSKEFRTLNILAKNNELYKHHIKTADVKININFDIKLRAVLMGEDNGNDILLNCNS